MFSLQTWNKPVYHFMKRHIAAPLVGRGVSPTIASVIVFTFSAILHEIVVGVPTHNIIGKNCVVHITNKLPNLYIPDDSLIFPFNL